MKLVVVCTHADSHFDYAKRALEAGKNVLVEKPFTPTIAEAKELFALAKSKGLTVTPYQNRRFDSCFLTAKKAIESGKLGEIVEIESHFDYYRGGGNPARTAAGRVVLRSGRAHHRTRLFPCLAARTTSAYDIRSLRNK
ncbi:Gfo/Idh/MocA family oxidoreductase [Enterobacter hormaechei]